LSAKRNVHDELNVGVVVVVGSAGHGHIVIRHLDVLGIRLQILRRDHHHKPNGALILEHFVCPSSDGTHALDGRDSVVGDQDSIDHTGAAEALHELLGGGDVEVTVLMAILAQASASRHARPGKDQEKGVSKNNIRNSIKKGGS